MKTNAALLVSDLDGTLLDRQHRISPENQRAIFDFQRHGGRFAFATGRSLCATLRFAGPLRANHGIPCNGAVIYNFIENRLESVTPMPPQGRDFLDELRSYWPDIGIQVFSDLSVFTLRDSEILRQKGVPEEYGGICTPWEALPDTLCKMTLAGEPDRLEELQALARSDFPELKALRSGRRFCEITSHDIDKGIGLAWLCQLYGVPLNRSAAVGDGENDIPMFHTAALAMAVENGMAHVKEEADHVIPSNSNHPMAQATELAMARFSMG